MMFGTNCPNDTDLMRCLGSSRIVPVDLDYGDVMFHGYNQIKVITERKKIGDLASCILGGRYLYQAQLAKQEGGADVLAVIVETGDIRANPDDGLLEVKVWVRDVLRGRMHEIWKPVMPAITYSRFDQYLTELDYLAGIIVKRSHDVHETACIIQALYTNFQLPPDKHNSLHQIYTQPTPVQLRKPSLTRRMAFCLDGVGWDRSGAVAERFTTPKAMIEATVKDWEKIDGIGKVTAEKVVKQLHGQISP